MSFKYKEEAQKVAKKLNISSISWIGEGEYGAAYETQDGRVLKITSDPNEFIYSSKLAGQKNENLVDIHNAFFIKDDLFAVVMEKVDTKGISLLFKALNVEASTQHCHITEINKNNLSYPVPEEAFKLMDGIIKASKQAKSLGIKINDIHQDNVGKRKNGEYVLFDQQIDYKHKELKEEMQKIKDSFEKAPNLKIKKLAL